MNHSRDTIDELCDDYEALWHRDHKFTIEQFLSAKSLPQEGELLKELIVLDVDLRFSAGLTVHQMTFEQRFPNHKSYVAFAFRRIDSCQDNDANASTLYHSMDGTGESTVNTTEIPEQLGSYEILEPLGKGGFGFVFRGRHRETQQDFALKFPKTNIMDSLEEYQQFRFEAEAAQHLDHPSIVKSYGLHEEGRFVFIVQQLVNGTNLQDAKRQFHDPEKAVRLIATLAEAIAYAHRQDLVHRDLKPSNVLITEDGIPLIADFGLTVHESFQRRLKGQRCGTAAYMSPEQVMGLTHQLDGRSDVWSLGVILYELLTERRPFAGPSDEDVFEEIKHRNERPLRMLRPALDNEIQRICLKCLSKPIRDRYNSADELADDLNNWLRHAGQWQTHDYAPLVPRGLVSYGPDDAEAFIELLPGTRNRHGLPQSIEQWKAKLESVDGGETFRVGIIFGPSGSGKSSFVKAGLIPNLDAKLVTPLYVEATGRDTEVRILKSFRNRWDSIPDDVSLPALMDGIRNNIWANDAHRIVIVLDQFEQWLQSTSKIEAAQLVQALRHCDGNRLCCILMVRDEYWLSTSRLTEALGVDFQEHQNASRLDRFEKEHALKVLYMIGRALGKLPDSQNNLTQQQIDLLEQVVNDLSEDSRVISVHLTLFAEMFKHRDWTLKELNEVGGVFAVGTQYLEQTFDSENSSKELRDIKREVKLVLEELLPEAGNNLKGHMKPFRILQNAVGEKCDAARFKRVLNILSDELRIISDTTPDHARQDSTDTNQTEKHYQLTHDYLVPAIRSWLAREKQTSWRGRAELKLNELSRMWKVGRRDRFLPNLLDHFRITSAIPRHKRTEAQQQFLSASNRLHGIRMVAILLIAAMLGAFYIQFRVNQRRERANVMARDFITEPVQVAPRILDDMRPYRNMLADNFRQNLGDQSAAVRLRSRIALLKTDPDAALDAEGILTDLTQLKDYAELRFFLDQLVDSGIELDSVLEEMSQFTEGKCKTDKEISMALLCVYTGYLDHIPTSVIDIHRTRADMGKPPSESHQDPSASTELAIRIKNLLAESDQPTEHQDFAEAILRYCDDYHSRIDLVFHLLVFASDLSPSELSEATLGRWRTFLLEEFENNPDSGIHGMCELIARRYEIDLSKVAKQLAASEPVEDRDWWIVEFPGDTLLTFVKVRPGQFTRNEGCTSKSFTQEHYFPSEPVQIKKTFWLATTEFTVQSLDPWLDLEQQTKNRRHQIVLENHYIRPISASISNFMALEAAHWLQYYNNGDQMLKQRKLFNFNPVLPARTITFLQYKKIFPWILDSLNLNLEYEIDIPIADQWEHAARCGSRTKFFWGNDQATDAILRYAVYTQSPFDSSSTAYNPPATRLPNRLGLFDLMGNVEELCKMTPRENKVMENLKTLFGNTRNSNAIGKGGGVVPSLNHSTSYAQTYGNIFSTTGLRWMIRECESPETKEGELQAHPLPR